MFNFLKKDKVLAKNSKKVKKWKKEHQQLVECATNIVSSYEKSDLKSTRKHLKKLEEIAFDHLMDEDITFFELLKKVKEKNLSEDREIIVAIDEFRNSFVGVKGVLIDFLLKYTNPEVELDDSFKETLDVIIDALTERISFEENNLYVLINN